MSRSRTAAALTALLALVGVVTLSPVASAGEDGPPYVIYGMGTVKTGIQLIAKVPGTKVRIPISERRGLHFLPSASRDGSVVAYITIAGSGVDGSWTTVVRKDGRVVTRVPFAGLGGVIPTVSDDGSLVISNSARGLTAFDVARATWRPLCPACPPMTSVTSAAISPDAAKVAVVRKINGTQYLDIRRISDGHRLAIADFDIGVGFDASWNPTSDTVAFSATEQIDGVQHGSVRTLTIRGVESGTTFHGAHFFTSPRWINNAVWALKTTMDIGDARNLRTVAVTAKNFRAPYVEFGTALYDGPDVWRGEIVSFGAWTSVAPAPARR